MKSCIFICCISAVLALGPPRLVFTPPEDETTACIFATMKGADKSSTWFLDITTRMIWIEKNIKSMEAVTAQTAAILAIVRAQIDRSSNVVSTMEMNLATPSVVTNECSAAKHAANVLHAGAASRSADILSVAELSSITVTVGPSSRGALEPLFSKLIAAMEMDAPLRPLPTCEAFMPWLVHERALGHTCAVDEAQSEQQPCVAGRAWAATVAARSMLRAGQCAAYHRRERVLPASNAPLIVVVLARKVAQRPANSTESRR